MSQKHTDRERMVELARNIALHAATFEAVVQPGTGMIDLPPMNAPTDLAPDARATAGWTGENGYARMMIRDLVTHVRLGVHAHERDPDRPQRIIVNIEMFADGKSHIGGEGLASVIDYDPVHKALAGWPTRPHVLLIETLLEELIVLCFRDPRVKACRVSIVKPDIYDAAAAAGVEIYRVRD